MSLLALVWADIGAIGADLRRLRRSRSRLGAACWGGVPRLLGGCGRREVEFVLGGRAPRGTPNCGPSWRDSSRFCRPGPKRAQDVARLLEFFGARGWEITAGYHTQRSVSCFLLLRPREVDLLNFSLGRVGRRLVFGGFVRNPKNVALVACMAHGSAEDCSASTREPCEYRASRVGEGRNSLPQPLLPGSRRHHVSHNHNLRPRALTSEKDDSGQLMAGVGGWLHQAKRPGRAMPRRSPNVFFDPISQARTRRQPMDRSRQMRAQADHRAGPDGGRARLPVARGLRG